MAEENKLLESFFTIKAEETINSARTLAKMTLAYYVELVAYKCEPGMAMELTLKFLELVMLSAKR